MRRPPLPLLAVLAAIVAGCGNEPAPPPRAPVQLALAAPRDTGTTGESSVAVTGTVVPRDARVLVLGERVAVVGGSFSTSVDLREGTNVIDVGASAPGRRAVWRALRVTRRSIVRMPDLLGTDEDEAKATLADLGLDVRVRNDDDLLDALRGGPRVVCTTIPQAGTQLSPSAQVEIVVSKTC